MIVETLLGLAAVVGDLLDGADLFGFDGGNNIQGNPGDLNVWGQRPSDIQGTPLGNDVWGRVNNEPFLG